MDHSRLGGGTLLTNSPCGSFFTLQGWFVALNSFILPGVDFLPLPILPNFACINVHLNDTIDKY